MNLNTYIDLKLKIETFDSYSQLLDELGNMNKDILRTLDDMLDSKTNAETYKVFTLAVLLPYLTLSNTILDARHMTEQQGRLRINQAIDMIIEFMRKI